MTSSRLEDFVGLGTSGDRPVSLDLPPTCAGFRYETDTGAWVWDGSSWTQITGTGLDGINELTGDVEAGPGNGLQAATITVGAVTNAKQADMAAYTIKANITSGSAAPQDADPVDVATLLAPYFPGSMFLLLEAHDSDYSLMAADSGKTLTTIGASSDVACSLPPAAAGIWFRFAVSTADYHKQIADGTETIVWGGDIGAAGGYMRSNVLGSVLRIECHDDGSWVAIAEEGSWSMDE